MLPDINASEDNCIIDFNLCKKNRLTYPGACSLEYQFLMRIFVQDLFLCNPVHQVSKGKGILGTVIVFALADEE